MELPSFTGRILTRQERPRESQRNLIGAVVRRGSDPFLRVLGNAGEQQSERGSPAQQIVGAESVALQAVLDGLEIHVAGAQRDEDAGARARLPAAREVDSGLALVRERQSASQGSVDAPLV